MLITNLFWFCEISMNFTKKFGLGMFWRNFQVTAENSNREILCKWLTSKSKLRVLRVRSLSVSRTTCRPFTSKLTLSWGHEEGGNGGANLVLSRKHCSVARSCSSPSSSFTVSVCTAIISLVCNHATNNLGSVSVFANFNLF